MKLTSVLLVFSLLINGLAAVEYFSWHGSGSTSNSDIKNTIIQQFHTGTNKAFGWKVPGDSMSLVTDPLTHSGHVLKVFYESGTRTNYDTHKTSCSNHGSNYACKRGAQFYGMDTDLYHRSKTFAALEYEVLFPTGFEFNEGGKLPGLYGGSIDGCKGCVKARDDCFSARLMWRAGGQGEVYSYQTFDQHDGWDSWCAHYSSNHKLICPDDGASHPCGLEIGKTSSGGFYFSTGKWHKIRLEVNLGNAGANGRISLWVDNDLKVNMKNIILRKSSSIHVEGLFFSTFYGGSGEHYGNHGDTNAYFKNFRISDEKMSVGGEYLVG